MTTYTVKIRDHGFMGSFTRDSLNTASIETALIWAHQLRVRGEDAYVWRSHGDLSVLITD